MAKVFFAVLTQPSGWSQRVPVIDLSLLQGSDVLERSVVVKQLGAACRQLGYFQIANHGIHPNTRRDALNAASDFFRQPLEGKADLESDDFRKPVRYCTNSVEGVDNVRTMLKHYAHPPTKWAHLWPVNPADYREKMETYAIQVRKAALLTLEAIFESLSLRSNLQTEDYDQDQDHDIDEGIQMMVVNGYKKWSGSDVSNIGLEPHTDYCCITIILQSCQGLEAMGRRGWVAVPHNEDTLHVHIGDQVEILSNGQYKSLKHRVVTNCNESRISISSIHCLPMEKKVSTAEQLVDERNPRRYRESSFSDLLDHLTSKKYNGGSFLDTLRIH